jgi:3-oxoacyl-[acyl-carrier protein] reductase
MLDFKGKVVVVTGGNRGIGRAIAEAFARQGADLVIGGRTFPEVEKAAGEISSTTGRKVVAVQVDVSDFQSANAFIEKAVSEFGRVNVLVNNAGLTRDKLLMRMDEEDWDIVLDTNLKGAFNCCKAVARPMLKQRGGRIVNVSSVSGLAGQVGQANYSASKAGMIGLTKALAREFASRNITVNAVAPGYVPTGLTNDLPEDLKESILKVTPLGRMGKPEEIANAVVFLASDEAAYITGQVLAVDGGMVMM